MIAGVVLRYEALVYLRPKDIAGRVLSALPDHAPASPTVLELDLKLADLDAQLAPLQDRHKEIVENARKRAYLTFGLYVAAMAAWGVGCVRLTWWELSWDVIEPIAFFAQLVGSIAMWAYAMRIRREFNYENMFDQLKSKHMSRLWAKRYASEGFDITKYELLMQETRRLQRRRQAIVDLTPLRDRAAV